MPIATVHRLRPRRASRQTELLQGALDLGGWSEPTRLEFAERLADFTPDGEEEWGFVMVGDRRDRTQAFLKAIKDGPRPFSTLATFYALPPFMRWDTGEIIGSQRSIAEVAGISQADVSRAFAQFCDMGVMIKEGKGRYRMHPVVQWKGTLANRARAAAQATPLRLVTSGPGGE